MTTSVETAATLLLALTALVLIGCADRVRLDEYAQTERREQTHLATFDDLDFNVFSGEKWDELDKSHSAGITVHWRDGRTTTGIEAHIADLKAMFVYAPDTRINEHPIRIASGGVDGRHGDPGGHVQSADADRPREDDSGDRQALQALDGHYWPVGRRYDG